MPGALARGDWPAIGHAAERELPDPTMTLTLRNRILLPTLALVALVTTAMSLVSYRMTTRSLNEMVDGNMATICKATVRQIENWLGNQHDQLAVLAGQRVYAQALADGTESAALRTELSGDLARMKALCGYYEDVHLIDTKGLARASSNPGSVDKLSVADRGYFQEAVKGKSTISEALASRTTGNPIVVLALPVKSGETLHGVLIGVVDLNWFSSRFISNIKVLQTGYVFVHDEKGLFLAHPQKEMILKSKLADFEWGSRVAQQSEGALEYTFEGITKTAVFAKSDQLKWGAVATVPRSEGNAAAHRMGMLNLAVSGTALVAGAVLIFLIARTIARRIIAVVDGASAGAEQTTAAAAQVSAASQSLAEGASEQAASLEESSSSLEEISSMTKRNAENALKASDLARSARSAADHGASDMQAMAQAMQEIKSSSDDIGKIIKTIDEIAFQTNILALNAAVEAARAGEAGMGFAVVADEVRNLAQRSAQAARETAGKIEGAIAKTGQGVEISGLVLKNLQEIVQKVRQVDELVAEVAAASKEQSQGIDQVNTAVGQIDKVTQSNAANAEESASASQELNSQADALRQSVAELRQFVEGRTTDAPPKAPRPTARYARFPRPSAAPASVVAESAGSNNGGDHAVATRRAPDSRASVGSTPALAAGTRSPDGFKDF